MEVDLKNYNFEKDALVYKTDVLNDILCFMGVQIMGEYEGYPLLSTPWAQT